MEVRIIKDNGSVRVFAQLFNNLVVIPSKPGKELDRGYNNCCLTGFSVNTTCSKDALRRGQLIHGRLSFLGSLVKTWGKMLKQKFQTSRFSNSKSVVKNVKIINI